MSPTKVSVIGCGIAGPVLAVLLKLKGYEPVVFERQDEVTATGLSLMLQPNGLKVLSLIPGLVDGIPGAHIERMGHYSDASKEILAENDLPSTLTAKYGFGMIGVKRATFHRHLVEVAESHGVQIHWGHQLVSLEQGENDVTVTFKNGATDKASFVIGCDGLHSNTRIALFGEEQPQFTGLVQTGGLSPTPAALGVKKTMANIFGVGSHIIAYPISETHTSWAVSSNEQESKESWRSVDEERQKEFKHGPHSQWAFGAGELVKTTEKIVKYGLYDRPELKTWYKGRVVLLGDAAHPTTPHLGQGANQAFEDTYHMIRVLTTHNPDSSTSPSTATLETAFAEYEKVRLPRTALLVKGAHAQGQMRVVADPEAARERDAFLKQAYANEDEAIKGYDNTWSGPYVFGQSEI